MATWRKLNLSYPDSRRSPPQWLQPPQSTENVRVLQPSDRASGLSWSHIPTGSVAATPRCMMEAPASFTSLHNWNLCSNPDNKKTPRCWRCWWWRWRENKRLHPLARRLFIAARIRTEIRCRGKSDAFSLLWPSPTHQLIRKRRPQFIPGIKPSPYFIVTWFFGEPVITFPDRISPKLGLLICSKQRNQHHRTRRKWAWLERVHKIPY